MGHRPRGLQPRRHGLGVLPARPRALAAPTAGARTASGGISRPPPAHLLRPRALERQRPDPQGAALRPDRQPRAITARTSRSYYFYLDSHADALVHEVPLQVPAGGVPVRRLRRGEPPARARRAGVRADRHRRLRRRPLLRRLRRVREGRPRGHPDPDHGHATAARSPRRSTCCRRSGSATPGRGRLDARRAARCAAERPAPMRGHHRRSTSRCTAGGGCTARARRRCSSPRTRPTPRVSTAGDRSPLRQGRHQRRRRARATRTRSTPSSAGTKAAAHYARRRAGRRPGALAPQARPTGSGRTGRRAVRGATSTDAFAAPQARGRRVLRHARCRRRTPPRRARRHAPGLRRPALVASSSITTTSRTGSEGDPAQPPPPPSRRRPQRATGRHLFNADVISMPDKWEYPWYAAWDLAFHCVPLALVDPEFAKEQLVLMLREWYMHPNGQMPGLRVGLRRRQPAGARLGRVARLQDREAASRRGRPHVPRARLPQAAAQLHLVGEPQGRRRTQRLPGRLSRPRQHRRLRPQRRCPPAATSSSRTARAGWAMYCLNMLAIALELADGEPGLRGRRQQVLRALRLHLPRP